MATKLKEILDLKLKVLGEKRALFKDNHTDIAFALFEVGNAYKDLGDYEHNLNYQLESLEMYRAIYQNKDHAFVAACCGNVGKKLLIQRF